MTTMQRISRKLARIIEEEIVELGHIPQEFYKKNKLYKKMWRMKSAKSFSSSGIESIISLAEKDG